MNIAASGEAVSAANRAPRDAPSLLPLLAANHRRIQRQGTPFLAAIIALGLMHVIPPLLPFAMAVGAVVAPVGFLAHAISLRLLLINPARREFRGSRSRRMIVRWTTRLAFLATAPPAYATLVAPGLGVLVVPVFFFGMNAAIYRYVAWHAERQQGGQGVHLVEKAVLVLVAVLAAVGFALTLVLAFGVGLLVQWVSEAM